MMIRFALSLLAFLAIPAMAQTEPATPPAPAPKPAVVRVQLQTSMGAITLELEKERAPITTANFLRYLDQKRLDGADFYRAMTVQEGLGLIQGGAKRDARGGTLPPIAHEPTTKTGLLHVEGTISMARGAPGTAASDFFILVGAMPSLDANPAAGGDNLGFAAFGHVVEGMDVVKAILAAPRSATLGEGVMKGQMLQPKVRIVSARRVK